MPWSMTPTEALDQPWSVSKLCNARLFVEAPRQSRPLFPPAQPPSRSAAAPSPSPPPTPPMGQRRQAQRGPGPGHKDDCPPLDTPPSRQLGALSPMARVGEQQRGGGQRQRRRHVHAQCPEARPPIRVDGGSLAPSGQRTEGASQRTEVTPRVQHAQHLQCTQTRLYGVVVMNSNDHATPFAMKWKLVPQRGGMQRRMTGTDSPPMLHRWG